MEGKGTNKKILVAAILFVVIAVAAVLLWGKFKPTGVQGSKEITVTVVDDQGKETVYEHKTHQEFLRAATEEIEGLTIEGTEDVYGLYIKVINGVTADFETNGAYWALYVNEEYGTYSIDEQPITNGDKFTLKYEIGN